MRQVQLIPFLARLAAEAGEMTGIAGVLLATLHNPVEVAECMASLNAIWRGKFIFGVGLGYRDVEFDAFAVLRAQRVRRFEQCLEVIKRLWTEDNVSFENDVCKLTNVTMTCRPVQQPHPPIWSSPPTMTARYGAPLGWATAGSPARMPQCPSSTARYLSTAPSWHVWGNRFRGCCRICARSTAPRTLRTALEMAGT